eukprot:Opistho-2@18769
MSTEISRRSRIPPCRRFTVRLRNRTHMHTTTNISSSRHRNRCNHINLRHHNSNNSSNTTAIRMPMELATDIHSDALFPFFVNMTQLFGCICIAFLLRIRETYVAFILLTLRSAQFYQASGPLFE